MHRVQSRLGPALVDGHLDRHCFDPPPVASRLSSGRQSRLSPRLLQFSLELARSSGFFPPQHAKFSRLTDIGVFAICDTGYTMSRALLVYNPGWICRRLRLLLSGQCPHPGPFTQSDNSNKHKVIIDCVNITALSTALSSGFINKDLDH